MLAPIAYLRRNAGENGAQVVGSVPANVGQCRRCRRRHRARFDVVRCDGTELEDVGKEREPFMGAMQPLFECEAGRAIDGSDGSAAWHGHTVPFVPTKVKPYSGQRSEPIAMIERSQGEGSSSPTLDVNADETAKVRGLGGVHTRDSAKCGANWRARQVSNLRPSA